MFPVEVAVEHGYQAPDPCDGMADPPEYGVWIADGCFNEQRKEKSEKGSG
jgi:hypothetical protein